VAKALPVASIYGAAISRAAQPGERVVAQVFKGKAVVHSLQWLLHSSTKQRGRALDSRIYGVRKHWYEAGTNVSFYLNVNNEPSKTIRYIQAAARASITHKVLHTTRGTRSLHHSVYTTTLCRRAAQGIQEQVALCREKGAGRKSGRKGRGID